MVERRRHSPAVLRIPVRIVEGVAIFLLLYASTRALARLSMPKAAALPVSCR